MGKKWGKILRRELLLQFLTYSHGIRHRCLPWGVDPCKTQFLTVAESVLPWVGHILWGKKWGKILRRELLPQFLTDSHGIRHRCLPWGVDVQDTVFDSGRKCVAMVTIILLAKNGGKSCVVNFFLSFWPILMEFGTDVPLGVNVQDTYFDSGRKCVAMVTAHYSENGRKQSIWNESWHRCWPRSVNMQYIFFYLVECALPWYTAHICQKLLS